MFYYRSIRAEIALFPSETWPEISKRRLFPRSPPKFSPGKEAATFVQTGATGLDDSAIVEEKCRAVAGDEEGGSLDEVARQSPEGRSTRRGDVPD